MKRTQRANNPLFVAVFFLLLALACSSGCRNRRDPGSDSASPSNSTVVFEDAEIVPTKRYVDSAELSPDDRYLVYCSTNDVLRCWDRESHQWRSDLFSDPHSVLRSPY